MEQETEEKQPDNEFVPQGEESILLGTVLSDPGDDVLLRFRYQITYAGVVAIIMVDETYDILEIYCEHHEDILVRHKGDKYSGIQVKTRDINLPPFTFEDEAIFNCFKRFVILDNAYIEKFIHFSIVSNHGFDKSKPAVCINRLIDNIKAGKDVMVARSKSKSLIQKLSTECKCPIENVINALKKVRLRSYCALNDIQMKLVNELKSCKHFKGATESKINDVADRIVTKMLNASSLNVKDDVVSKYILGIYESEDEITSLVASKCINREEFTNWLTAELINPATLLLKDRAPIPNTPNGYGVLEIKMDAGGVDAENIDLTKDFKFSFEQHAASWIYKNNIEEAEAKYNQVLKVTQNLCKEVYDEENVENTDKSGQQMLVNVRKRIRERKENEPDIFFDCSYEHVIGAVGVLTENCKVWWSKKFDIL